MTGRNKRGVINNTASHKSPKTALMACLIAVMALLLAACGGGGAAPAEADAKSSDSGEVYEAPKFRDVAFDEASAEGMVTMDTSLFDLYQKGRITKDTLLTSCNNYEFMVKKVGL